MTEVGALRISLTLDSADFTSDLRNINTRLNALNSELRTVSTGAGRFDNSLDALRTRADILNRTLATHQQRVEALRQRYEQSAQANGENATSTIRLAGAYNRAVAAMNETEHQLRQTTTQIEQQSNAWHRLRTRATEIGDNLSTVGGKMQSMGADISQSFGVAFLGVAGGLGLAAKKAMDFESQMSSVKSVMAPDEVNQFGDALNDLAIKLGADTKFSALEAAQGIEELIKAGVQTTDIINGGLEGALSLAVSGELNLADAAEIASTALNAFKGESLSVMDAADLLAGAANASATSVSEMKQGLSMVAAVASGVGLSFKDTSTALAVFAQNGLKGSDAGTSLKTMLLNLSPHTKEAYETMDSLNLASHNATAGYNYLISKGITPLSKAAVDVNNSLHDLAERQAGAGASANKIQKAFDQLAKESGYASTAFYDTNGNLKSMSEIAGILQKALSGMNAQQRQVALQTMFGTDAIRAANILYKEGTVGINNMAEAMSKIKSADVAATKLNNVKGAIEQLKGSFETAAISLGNTLLPTIEKVAVALQKATDWFNGLSDGTKETIVNVGLVVAGVTGLVTVIGGSLAIVGSAIEGIGALATAFGVATTAVEILSGPIGWGALLITAGLTAGGVLALNNATKEHKEITLDALQATQKEIQSNENLIENYEALKNKNKLTNDEMMRFLDIQAELETTSSPDTIKALKESQEELLKKSGLTNKEMDDFLKYNDLIIEKSPNTEKAITSQGKAYALNADALKQANDEKLKSLKMDAESFILTNLNKELKLQKEKQDLVSQIKEKENERKATYDRINEISQKLADKEKEITDLKSQGNNVDAKKLSLAQQQKIELSNQLANQQQYLKTVLATISEKEKSLEVTRKDLKALDDSKYQYEQIVLATIGMTVERGKGLETLQLEIAKLEDQKAKLNEVRASGKLNTQEYNEQVIAIDEQIGKLQGAKTELDNINTTAGKKIYKDIEISKAPKEYAEELNKLLSQTITKEVQVIVNQNGNNIAKAYAKGTRYAPGGLSLVGERGRELTYSPNGGMALVSGPTLLNLPRGAKVIPNYDTEKILRNWNVPKLKGGGVTVKEGWAIAGERGREIVDFSGTGAMTSPYSSGMNAASYGPVYVNISAKDVREFIDIIDFFKRVSQAAKTR